MSCDGILVEVRSCVVCDVKEQSLLGDGGQGANNETCLKENISVGIDNTAPHYWLFF